LSGNFNSLNLEVVVPSNHVNSNMIVILIEFLEKGKRRIEKHLS